VATKTSGRDQTSYSWDTNAPLALETDARRGRLLRSYTYGAGPLELRTPRASFTYHSDSLGSTVELSDRRGNEVASYRYTPYGEEWSSGTSSTSNETAANPIRFTGQYLDSDSGLYYMRAREYDPSDGRFLETDPVSDESTAAESDLSSYLYAEDDPTLLTDPSGLDPCFGGKTLNCKHNQLLCKFIRGTGYRDGCRGQCVKNALIKLAWRGIDFNYIYAAEIGKGWLVNGSDGLYFVGGRRSQKIKPPKSPNCGLACAFGKGTTIALGCNSTVTCGVMGALIVLPGIAEARAAARAEVAGEEAVIAARGVEAAEEATGQLHHIISKPIARALAEHPNLAGTYEARDARYVSRAADAASHRGYQGWHREVDRNVVAWLGEHGEATPEQFDSYLRKLYDSPELKKRFPNAF
jgi:RHS repeat-associated protein